MQKRKSLFLLVLWLTSSTILAQAGQQVVEPKDGAPLDAQREKRALQSLLKIAEREIVSAVDAMPADKFGFAPTDGEFKGVRTFELRPCDDGSSEFVMEERFSGLMLPFAKGSMPDFGPVFEHYANDLKREAERLEPLRRHV